MKAVQKGILISLLWVALMAAPCSLQAQTPQDEDAQRIITLLKAQNSKLSGDLRRIQREIAALRADLDKPDLKDIFGGIGYIFGLFGVAAFFSARRKKE